MNDGAGLVLRLGLGIMFLAHGLQIAFGLFGGPGVVGFSKMLTGMIVFPSIVWSYLAAYSTLIGGACLIIGLYTRLAVIPLLIFILVAMFKVHITKGFFLANGGYEYTFIIACALIALSILGGGKYGITGKF
jgi:putative oxidoreductase